MSYESHADLGGQANHDPVVTEPEGELFHADWERIAMAITLAMGATGTWNIDTGRSVRETQSNYDSLTYYQLWVQGLIALLKNHGLVEDDEVAAGQMLHPAKSLKRVLRAVDVPAVLAKGAPTLRASRKSALFAVGDQVKTRPYAVDHHTRLPAYARGKSGRIAAVYGPHVFADTHAQELGEQPQWLYNVVFTAQQLWGDDADATSTVSIDAWESYLE
jgi:nitrile hydratase subunit beta